MNLLHTFLNKGNVQALTVLGELFTYGSQSDLIGFFTPTDEKLAFELTGYMDEIDFALVVAKDQFTSGNEPATKAQLTYASATYTIRSLKTDQSAYVLGLKKITV